MTRPSAQVINRVTVDYSRLPSVLSLRTIANRLTGTKHAARQWPPNWLRSISVQNLYRALIEPRGKQEACRHREFMVNVLLGGLAIITAVKIGLTFIADFELGFDQEEDSLLLNGIFLILVLAIWRLSRHGQRQVAAYSLLGLLCLEAMRVTLSWSFELPVAELMYAVVIVTAGIILTARAAIIVTSAVSGLLLGISYAQTTGYLRPHTYWIDKPFQISDTFGYMAILGVIALVTWLTNRDVSQSLARAYASEAALAEERDNLELLVRDRTRDLLQSQLLRNVELERFAEFGRVSASLLHEVANPLTAASINLELAGDDARHDLARVRKNLQQLERYVQAARQQLKTSSKLTRFSVAGEFKRLALIMDPQAKHNGVKIIFESTANCKLFGDAVKFNQLLANLIANSLDAYQNVNLGQGQKLIRVKAETTAQSLKLTVSDWGKGIPAESMSKLFEPFYTTKSDSERGTGIGLTMVKRVVEEDFGGTIKVSSSPSRGTNFVVKLKLR